MHPKRFLSKTGKLVILGFSLLGLSAVLSIEPEPAQAANATQRPISDFIDKQGTNASFIPPIGDYVGWFSALNKTPVTASSIDYAGLSAKFLKGKGIDLKTTIEGTVHERPLADGRAEVSVNLHAKNALDWAFRLVPKDLEDPFLFAKAPLIYGYRAGDLAANPKLTPALGECHFQIVFKNTKPGAPLPDIVVAIVGSATKPPDPPKGFELIAVSMHSQSTGPLRALAGLGPEGTPGRCTNSQTGLIGHGSGKGALSDGFPVEKIEVRAIGK